MQQAAENSLAARMTAAVEDAKAQVMFAGFTSKQASPEDLAQHIINTLAPKIAEAVAQYGDAERKISLVCN